MSMNDKYDNPLKYNFHEDVLSNRYLEASEKSDFLSIEIFC